MTLINTKISVEFDGNIFLKIGQRLANFTGKSRVIPFLVHSGYDPFFCVRLHILADRKLAETPIEIYTYLFILFIKNNKGPFGLLRVATYNALHDTMFELRKIRFAIF